MISRTKDFGIVILLDAMGTRQRLLDDIGKYLADWDSVLNNLNENIRILEYHLSSHGYRIATMTSIKRRFLTKPMYIVKQ